MLISSLTADFDRLIGCLQYKDPTLAKSYKRLYNRIKVIKGYKTNKKL